MNHELGQKLTWTGIVLYLAILALQLYYFFFNVGFILFPILMILAQIAMGLPVLMALQKKIEIPIYDYAKGLALMVSVLAVSGYLGLPEGALRMGDDQKSSQAAILSTRESLGEYKKLDLAVDLAAAKTDEEKKQVNEAIEKVSKDLSAADREEYQRELAVLRAKSERDEWGRDLRRTTLARAYLDNGLIVIGAFLILLGACLAQRPKEGAAAAR